MSISIPDFWKLVRESRLLTAEQCQLLDQEFSQVKGVDTQGNAKVLSQWLISRNALTQYQATILEAGRSGPFHYGDYKVYDRVEQGPMSGCFRAIHEPTTHPVALNFVTGDATKDRDKWIALVDDVQGQAKILHANLSRCFEPVDLSSFKFVVTEDLPGETLDGRLAHGAFRPADACRVARLAAMALSAIHQAGQVHGDVRPHNLWLDSAGGVKLGRDPLFKPQPVYLARADASSDLLIRADYMAPEMAQQGKDADALTDIYALGCTFYHLLSGRPPFAAGDVMQKLNFHATQPIQPLEQFGVPTQIGQLVAYMMAKNPAVRYQQADVIAEQLAQFVEPTQLNIQAAAPPPSLPAYETWIKQKQSTLAANAPAPAQSFPGVKVDDGSPPVGAPVVSAQTNAVPTRVTSSSSTSSPTSASPNAPKPAPAKTGMSERFDSDGLSKKNIIMLASGLGAAALVMIVIFIGMSMSSGEPEAAAGDDEHDKKTVANNIENTSRVDVDPQDPQEDKTGEEDPDDEPEAKPSFIQTVVKDDKLPWASPTNGPAIDLSYVPQGDIYIIARPADLVESPEGKRVLQALGPVFDTKSKIWERDAGFLMNQIEQVIISLHPDDTRGYRPAFVVYLRDPVREVDLLQAWQGPPKAVSVSESESNYYKAAQWSFYVPEDLSGDGVKLFAMGSEEEMKAVALKGKAPPLIGRMGQLLAWSDRNRHLTALFAPISLRNDSARKLFTGEFAKVVNPVDELLGDGVSAVMFSMHFGEHFYVELRAKNDINKNINELLEDYRKRLNALPGTVQDYVIALGDNPYWQKLRFNFPQMVKFLGRQMRSGVEGEQVLFNSVMPGNAGHNLIAGTELAIATPPGATFIAGDPGPMDTGPKTIEELLAKPIDLIQIPEQDLINAAADIQTSITDSYRGLPFPFQIRLLGNDLFDDGITKNQKVVNFKTVNEPISTILTKLVMTANPITTVKDPSEADQKLIWVVGPDPDSGEKIVLITTRKAAATKSYTLPKPFQPK